MVHLCLWNKSSVSNQKFLKIAKRSLSSIISLNNEREDNLNISINNSLNNLTSSIITSSNSSLNSLNNSNNNENEIINDLRNNNDNLNEIDYNISDVESAILLILQRIPFNLQFPKILFKHQLYPIIKNQTEVFLLIF